MTTTVSGAGATAGGGSGAGPASGARQQHALDDEDEQIAGGARADDRGHSPPRSCDDRDGDEERGLDGRSGPKRRRSPAASTRSRAAPRRCRLLLELSGCCGGGDSGGAPPDRQCCCGRLRAGLLADVLGGPHDRLGDLADRVLAETGGREQLLGAVLRAGEDRARLRPRPLERLLDLGAGGVGQVGRLVPRLLEQPVPPGLGLLQLRGRLASAFERRSRVSLRAAFSISARWRSLSWR